MNAADSNATDRPDVQVEAADVCADGFAAQRFAVAQALERFVREVIAQLDAREADDEDGDRS